MIVIKSLDSGASFNCRNPLYKSHVVKKLLCDDAICSMISGMLLQLNDQVLVTEFNFRKSITNLKDLSAFLIIK